MYCIMHVPGTRLHIVTFSAATLGRALGPAAMAHTIASIAAIATTFARYLLALVLARL